MFSLPEGLGTAEVVIEPIKGVGRMNAERVVAYILAADMDTSSPAHPTDVRIRLEYPDREAQTLPLQPDSAPQGSGRFVSQPGTYMVEPLIGELTMTLGGREVNGRFAGAR
jgi:hypothetical protein